jgi:3-oxoacyl-[acyl-carrier protein] reductase
MGNLNGRVAIVSGSGRGIGRAIAEKLAAEGASVVVNDIDEAPANETVAAIEAAGGTAVACVGDVTAGDFGERFVNVALENFGNLHIIVNNAGYTWDDVIQKMSDEQFQAMLDVHTVAPFRVLRAAALHIRTAAKSESEAGQEVYRKVVNISSVSAFSGIAGQINYSSAKASLLGMTRTLAKEWGRYRVNVNCVGFGFIETRLTQSVKDEKPVLHIGERDIEVGIPEQSVAVMRSMIPLGRPGTVKEAAGAVYLFCTPESNYVTGETIICGGGFR